MARWLLLLSLTWFYIATFVIIPHFAAQAYGVGATPYAARYGALGDSFGGVLRVFITQPLTVAGIIVEPLRLRYLVILLAPTAFMALFGLEVVAIGLPLLLANLLSAFPFQYAAELHYSTPLAPIFAVAGVVGFTRLIRNYDLWRNGIQFNRRRASGPKLALGLVVIVALWAQIALGYTPLGLGFWRGETQGWPQVTPHDRLLSRFAVQIPTDAPLSVATDLYPHLSHRKLIYPFPTLGQATWALVDVAGEPDRHPADIQVAIHKLMGEGWGVVDAADGYLLLARGQGQAAIPDAFYDFVRAPRRPAATLVGCDLRRSLALDRLRRRGSAQVAANWLPLLLADCDGASTQYKHFGPGADARGRRGGRHGAASAAGDALVSARGLAAWRDTRDRDAALVSAARLCARAAGHGGWSAAGGAPRRDTGIRASPWRGRRWAGAPTGLGARGGKLVAFNRPFYPAGPGTACFTSDDWAVKLVEWAAPIAAAPSSKLRLAIRWSADGPADRDYSVFVHLRDATGRTTATGDAAPIWFTPRPTSVWQADAEGVWAAYALNLPADLIPGRYDLVVGWYDWQTGKRLTLSADLGNAGGDEVVLGPVTVDHRATARPDLACLLAPESCASQEE